MGLGRAVAGLALGRVAAGLGLDVLRDLAPPGPGLAPAAAAPSVLAVLSERAFTSVPVAPGELTLTTVDGSSAPPLPPATGSAPSRPLSPLPKPPVPKPLISWQPGIGGAPGMGGGQFGRNVSRKPATAPVMAPPAAAVLAPRFPRLMRVFRRSWPPPPPICTFFCLTGVVTLIGLARLTGVSVLRVTPLVVVGTAAT